MPGMNYTGLLNVLESTRIRRSIAETFYSDTHITKYSQAHTQTKDEVDIDDDDHNDVGCTLA